MMERYLTDEHGQRTAVVVPIEEYERLQEAEAKLDELEDIRLFDEAMELHRRGEDDAIPWEKVEDRIGSEYGKE